MKRSSVEQDYDIIVVGGGGAGMAAALCAHKQRARVVILEADKKLGGATALSDGVVYAAGTSVQRKKGIVDSSKDMFDYIMTLNAWKTRPDIIRILAERSAASVEWLIELGCEYEWVVKSGVDLVPRGHCTVGAGASIGRALSERVGGDGIEVVVNTRVDRLVLEAGAVVGVHASGVDLRAPAVIITTGGFANSPGMMAKYFPSAAQHGEVVYAAHHDAPFVRGDGIKFGELIGAAITGHDTGLVLPSAGLVPRVIEAYLPPWIILVNVRGRRFMSENAPYAVSGYLINEQPEARAWAVFDEVALSNASHDKRWSDPYHTGHVTPVWDEALLREHASTGRVRRGNSLEDLAEKINVDPLALLETARRYNYDARIGVDTAFEKEAPTYFSIDTPPFYAVEIRPAFIGQTSAGLDIDSHACVRDVHGRAIPGLFAAGETVGCIQGVRYSGGGMGVGSALTFGRLAGEEAAKAVQSHLPA